MISLTTSVLDGALAEAQACGWSQARLDWRRTLPVEGTPNLTDWTLFQSYTESRVLPATTAESITTAVGKGRLPVGQNLGYLHIKASSLLSSMKMANLEPPVESKAGATIDVGAIWKVAMDRYEEITTVKIESLTGASNVDEILKDIRERETKFKGFRHDGSKLDKFRTLVSKSLNPIDTVGNMVALAASTVRRQPLPAFRSAMAHVYMVIVLPSQHCHLHSCPLSYQRMIPVLLYRMILNKSQTANNVSADYDKIVEVFEDLDLYLSRLKILEKQVRTVPELNVALAQVLASVLVLCGICAKYVKMKRLGNYTFSSFSWKLSR